MSSSNFNKLKFFSNLQIFDSIKETENELLKLKLKKVNRKPFKSHEIKSKKIKLVQLKTILTLRLNLLEKKQIKTLKTLIKN
uniref:Ribosomal protein L29 n=1 Tax=Toxarium undulatum TaxID=210620 RepID=A0A1D8DCU1_9STRA|nr:ribosomal protein L29 [Toxarium undulatum]AOS86654.1 ribosomal protein L29 [Toxarium undulatum]